MPRSIAVTGGAGYIGSHMCKMLAQAGHRVTVIDDLSTGHAQAVQWGSLQRCSIADAAALRGVFAQERFDAVIHFAGAIVVSESVSDPLKYYQANLAATLTLLQTMREAGVDKLVFSSTAAIFGEPRQDAIDERHVIAPISPYGQSKAMVEQVLRDSAAACGLDSVVLRYFNAAGADPSGVIGEAHEPETHLIPRLLELAQDPNAEIAIFGTDHPTPDGTCVRDYIHVEDLCAAHLLALDHLDAHRGFHAFNLGNGRGFSVYEVLRAVETVTGCKLQPRLSARREGDPARLVASPAAAMATLGWKPRYDSLEAIVATAWNWQRQRRY
jgi:UDP-glucose 4-epimerase